MLRLEQLEVSAFAPQDQSLGAFGKEVFTALLVRLDDLQTDIADVLEAPSQHLPDRPAAYDHHLVFTAHLLLRRSQSQASLELLSIVLGILNVVANTRLWRRSSASQSFAEAAP